MNSAIHYAIIPVSPEAHLFRVSCTVPEPDPQGQRFSLPVWIPGSYMIREFARNIVTIRAEADGKPVGLSKLDKNSWQAEALPEGQALVVEYEVYAWDLSVRAAHLDQTHGFFNGTSVFLAVHGQTDRLCRVDIQPPQGDAYADWRLATTLRAVSDPAGPAATLGFGCHEAHDYDELVDHPVEMGRFDHAVFDALGVRHEIVLSGRHDCDTTRLCADLARVCAWQIRLFGEPAPVERYLFMTMVVGDGYGGLEHRASTALIASRKDLPWLGMQGMPEGYLTYLGLCSHEYFHTWNVKRIKPAAFVPYDLDRENYTRLLWLFEGFTSYYDDLALVRSGLISADDYLKLLGKTVSNVLRGSGRLKQSVAESSFDAWTKYYRQDENAPNAIVSYYAKGALVALALDLQWRAASDGRGSLDDLMRALWQRHGKTGVGVGEDEIFGLLAEVAAAQCGDAARGLADWLREAVEGTEDLPLAGLLKGFGVAYQLEPSSPAPSLGARLSASAPLRVLSVHDGGAAQAAGLSAGDELVALDGLRVPGDGLESMLTRRQPGDKVALQVFRRDELMRFELTLQAPERSQVKLSSEPSPTEAASRLRAGWLGEALEP